MSRHAARGAVRDVLEEPKRGADRPGRMRSLPAALLSLLVVAGCSLIGPPLAVAPALEGRMFLSTSVKEGGEDRGLVPGTRISVGFGDGDLGADAGCNRFGGAYRLDGNRLIVENLGGTEMGCEPQRQQQDEWLTTFLASRPRLALSGNDLVLASDTTVITLLDREVATPDLPLEGTTWTVDTMVAGEGASSVPAGVEATLRFTPDGRFEVDTGCNTGGGPVTVDGDRLAFGEFRLTRRACAGGAAEMEEAVLAVLRSAEVRYRIDASRLDLVAGDRGLGLIGR